MRREGNGEMIRSRCGPKFYRVLFKEGGVPEPLITTETDLRGEILEAIQSQIHSRRDFIG